MKGVSARYRFSARPVRRDNARVDYPCESSHRSAVSSLSSLMTQSIVSRARAVDTAARGALTHLEFVPDDTGRIGVAGVLKTTSCLSLSLSFRTIYSSAWGDPSSLMDTRIYLVSFLSAKWPGFRPRSRSVSFLSDSTPRYLSEFLSFCLRKAECT